MTTVTYETAVTAMLGALTAGGYATLWYFRKRRKNGEEFNHAKFAGTVLVGIIVGAGYGLSGQPVTEETIFTAMVANAGIIALVEPVLKWLLLELGVATEYSD